MKLYRVPNLKRRKSDWQNPDSRANKYKIYENISIRDDFNPTELNAHFGWKRKL